jgi:hypothetical protein
MLFEEPFAIYCENRNTQIHSEGSKLSFLKADGAYSIHWPLNGEARYHEDVKESGALDKGKMPLVSTV